MKLPASYELPVISVSHNGVRSSFRVKNAIRACETPLRAPNPLDGTRLWDNS